MQATFFSGFSDTSEALDFMLEKIQSNFQIGKKVFLNLDNDLLIKFEDVSSIKLFEQKYPQIIESLRKSLVFKESVFVGVCAFTFEQEAALTEK